MKNHKPFLLTKNFAKKVSNSHTEKQFRESWKIRNRKWFSIKNPKLHNFNSLLLIIIFQKSLQFLTLPSLQ